MAARRISKELQKLQDNGIPSVCDIGLVDDQIFEWEITIVPDSPPYSEGAFKVGITYPSEYPFKPPRLVFKTKIYHPNVAENGDICLQIISAEHWRPETTIRGVITALLNLMNEPNVEHPLRADLAEEYRQDRETFMRNAEEFTRTHALERPSTEE